MLAAAWPLSILRAGEEMHSLHLRCPLLHSCPASHHPQFETGPPPPVVHEETPAERRARRRAARAASHQLEVDQAAAVWDPKSDSKTTRDAYRTLFVSRLAYETTERKLQREFEQFGPISSVRLIKDASGQSRGYAFIEFKEEEDLKRAYKRADGIRIDNRRVLVDVERGRTVKGAWRRRRGGRLAGRTGARSESSMVECDGQQAPCRAQLSLVTRATLPTYHHLPGSPVSPQRAHRTPRLSCPFPPSSPVTAGWKPRRLGGGLGDTRKEKEKKGAAKKSGPGWVNAPIGYNFVIMSVAMKEAAAAARAAAQVSASQAAPGASGAGPASSSAGAGAPSGARPFY